MQTLLPDERWTQVEALFQEAADLPPGSREAYVDRRCSGDTALRDEVLSLLRYDTREEPPLLEALQASAASLVVEAPTEGRMLGPYRIEKEIGRGGMSVVYSAIRADGEFQKRVAIKLIKRGMDTHAVIERLRRERRILATLEHPSIARLLDGGTTPDGLPWIAMEYVEGQSIHRYCAERGLATEQICRLFDAVADAVAYAHRKLVVHLDLKPGNILVTPDGTPKLLDFGISKVLSGEGRDDEAAPATRGSVRPFTPEYASPEQVRGDTAGTAADIYSLGVVLFELLSGQRPRTDLPVENLSAAAARSGKDKRTVRNLSGDLSNILSKALRTEPDRRYPTVEQFQSDLRRCLAGLPVSARRETWPYRLRKFVGRHPYAVTAAALAGIAAVSFGFVERQAQLQAAKSEKRLGELLALANTALFDVPDAIENLPGSTQARLEIARKTSSSLDKLGAESGNDTRVLAALAAAYANVARVEGNPNRPNLGDERSSEQNYAKAEKILTEVLTRDKSVELLVQNAAVRSEYGEVLLDEGHREEALARFRTALAQLGAVIVRDPHHLAARKLFTHVQVMAAEITAYKDPPGTRRTLLAAQPVFDALARENPGVTDYVMNLADFWSHIGLTYDLEGNLQAAMENYRRVTQLQEPVYTRKPADAQVQRDLMLAYGHLGDVAGSPTGPNLGDYRAAAGWFGKAAAIADKMVAADPANILALSDQGIVYMRIATTQMAAGDFRDGFETASHAEAILKSALKVAPERFAVLQALAYIDKSRARADHVRGAEAAALAELEKGEDLCRAGIARQPESLTWNHMLMFDEGLKAAVLAALGENEAALKQAQAALERATQHQVPHDPAAQAYVARALAFNGEVHSDLARRSLGGEQTGQWRMAAGFYRRSVDTWQAFPGHADEPNRSDMRRAEEGLAEAGRHLPASAARGGGL